MRTLLLLIACFIPATAATPQPVAHISAGNGGGGLVVTAPIDTTGANTLLVYVVSDGWHANSVAITDSYNNPWTALNDAYSGTMGGCWFVAAAAHTGAAHTFRADPGGSFMTLFVSAWSGLATAGPWDRQATFGSPAPSLGMTPFQTGSVTPSQSGELIVSAISEYHPNADNYSVDSGFTIIDKVASGSTLGGAIAYLVQTSAGPVNPSWNHNDAGFGLAANTVTLTPLTSTSTSAAAARHRSLN
jgi:hypothetical protein